MSESDLDVLAPPSQELMLAGKPLTITPLVVGELPAMLRAVQPFARDLAAHDDLPVDDQCRRDHHAVRCDLGDLLDVLEGVVQPELVRSLLDGGLQRVALGAASSEDLDLHLVLLDSDDHSVEVSDDRGHHDHERDEHQCLLGPHDAADDEHVRQ